MMNILDLLGSKKHEEAYQLLLQLERESKEDDGLYGSLDAFLLLLKDKSSLVRTRGFRLICAQARWDGNGWFREHLEEVLSVLEEEKATAMRQYLAALHQVIFFLPELSPQIGAKLDEIDLSKQKESMRSLLQKDIEELRVLIRGERHCEI